MIQQQRISTVPAEQAPNTIPARICQEPGCRKRLHSDNQSGYCWPHYHPKNRPSVERKVVCQWTGCDNRLGSNNKNGLCGKHRQRKTTTRRHLTRAEKVVVDRRIAELCAQHISGPELTARLNLEFGLNWASSSYRQRARLRKQPWTEGRRRLPEIPLAELPICNYCGKVRMPVPYQIGSKGGQALLCENRCCPDCGAKLEAHSKPKGGNWVHTLPLPPRNCSVCGTEFTPNNIERPHKETCSDFCMQSASKKKWKATHQDQVREQNKQGNLRRQAELAELDRLKALPKGGRPAEDGIAVQIDPLYKQRMEWPAIKQRLDNKTNGFRSADAYRKLYERWRERQNPAQ